MKSMLCGSVLVAGMMLGASTAQADRTMVVVVDATGSMQAIRPSDSQTRFEAARALAADRVFNAAMEAGGLGSVAVYTFAGSSITQWTSGGSGSAGQFVSATTARNVILNNIAVTSDITPLADSLCSTADIASASGSGSTTTRFLEVWSDGAENASTGPCSGPFSTTGFPYDGGSWQQLVYAHISGLGNVTFNGTLFTDVSSFAAFAPSKAAPATADSAPTAFVQGFAAISALVSDAEFFADLARGTGGTFAEINDTAPLPVFGDNNGDFDVDRGDLVALARNFGGLALGAYDLNADGKVGFADYSILQTKFGNHSAGTPDPDPYTTGDTIHCSTGQVVIDGKAIEDFSITVDTNNPCVVTIRNSLIVSGSFAVKTHGSLTVTVDDSIIVGEVGWISATGAVKLSAANSVFHGPAHGSKVKLTDRGGNVFE